MWSESCCRQMVPNGPWWHSRCNMYRTQISSLDAVRAATAACTMYRFWHASVLCGVQNLVYGCGNVPQTIAESSDTSQIHCVQHVQESLNMSIKLPSGLQCNLNQMAEVVQQEYILIGGVWHGWLARWIKWRACDVGEAKGLENELWHRWSNGRVGEWALM